ncbi:hypothetical protein SEUCBS139899_001128 [Sporothrix eucalyptigena]
MSSVVVSYLDLGRRTGRQLQIDGDVVIACGLLAQQPPGARQASVRDVDTGAGVRDPRP